MNIRNALLKLILSVIAVLPFRVIYFLSDIFYYVIFYLISYRKETVINNLSICFPEKDKKEILKIAKKFYRNFSDFQFEIIKSFKMTRKQVDKRVILKNKELLDQLYEQKKSVIVALGHCGNWEWVGNKIGLHLRHEGAAIYKPLEDKFFDDYMISIRQKYKGTLMIHYKKTLRILLNLRQKLYSVFMLADQSPAKNEINYWTYFLGRETPFYIGMEKIAKALNYAVIYLDVQKKKRGFYIVDIKMIAVEAKNTKPLEIINKYMHNLETSVRNNPDNWLWSHRRWKHKKEELDH